MPSGTKGREKRKLDSPGDIDGNSPNTKGRAFVGFGPQVRVVDSSGIER